MEDFNGQPDVPSQEAPEQKLEAGTEALQPQVVPDAPQVQDDVVELRWGREARSVRKSVLDGLSDELETSPEAVKTWLQMGRDASRVYNESRERERQAAQLLEQERVKHAAEIAQFRTPAAPPVKRRSVADDPVAFWDDVAVKLDKLDNLGRLDRLEQMVEKAVGRMDEERTALNEMELQNQYVSEHKSFMDEMKDRKLPYVDPETLAQVIDRYIKEVPDGTTIREVIEAGYKIATWDRLGKAPNETKPRRQVQAPAITASPVVTAAERSDGAQKPNETLEERRARLHRAVGGIRVGDVLGAFDG